LDIPQGRSSKYVKQAERAMLAASTRVVTRVFKDFSIELEVENRLQLPKSSVCVDFRSLFGHVENPEAFLQCLKLTGMQRPNVFQKFVIPPLVEALGAGALRAAAGRMCLTVQGPAQCGKTSALALAIVGATDPALNGLQVIVVTASPNKDLERFLSVFTLTHRLATASLPALEPGVVEDPAAFEAAKDAQIIYGYPARVRALLSSVPVRVEHMRTIVVDDASALNAAGGSLFADILHIAATLELRRNSVPPWESELQPGSGRKEQIRAVILAGESSDLGVRKIVRRLRVAFMRKKTPMGVEPMNVARRVSHYTMRHRQQDWVKVLINLVESLMLTRVVLFCDGNATPMVDEMRKAGLSVSCNLEDDGRGRDMVRRDALTEFCSGATQFLVTISDTHILQGVIPKVSCIVHVGVPRQCLTLYATRLLPIDQTYSPTALSVLFEDGAEVDDTILRVERLFKIQIQDLPPELLPS